MNKFKKTVAACLVAQFACGYAYAAEVGVNDAEPNSSFTQPQDLSGNGISYSDSKSIKIAGKIGSIMSNGDADFYTIFARSGQNLSFDIPEVLDTNIAVYDEADGTLKIADNSDGVGSSHAEYLVQKEGRYIVGVTTGRKFVGDSGTLEGSVGLTLGFDYTLNIKEVAPEAGTVDISIDVKPGQGDTHSQGAIPVALLSSPAFKPMTVVRDSLRFGQQGTENSLIKCNRFGADLNHDGELDLICHFNSSKAGFGRNSEVGIVTGKVNDTAGGSEIKGRGSLKAKKAK